MNSTETSTRGLTIQSCPEHTLLRLVWEELGRRYPPDTGLSLLVYGAGKFTKRLLRQTVSLPNGPAIAAVIDDQAAPNQILAGHRVQRPRDVARHRFSAVFLGTDYFEDRFAEQCRAAYGADCPIVRYSELTAAIDRVQSARKAERGPPDLFRPSQGDPYIDISTTWQTAYGLMRHHECNDFKDNLLLAIAMNIKPANAERATEYGFALRHIAPPGANVLDIGSSDSPFPRALADRGFRVTCLEPLPRASADPRIRVLRGDVRRTDLPEGQFDVITCISTLEHIGLPGRYGITEEDPAGEINAMREMHRLLKPGGRLILTVPFGQYAMLPLNRVYTREGIMRLKGGFQDAAEEFYTIDREGAYVPATSREASESDLRLDGYYALGCFVFTRALHDPYARLPHEVEFMT